MKISEIIILILVVWSIYLGYQNNKLKKEKEIISTTIDTVTVTDTIRLPIVRTKTIVVKEIDRAYTDSIIASIQNKDSILAELIQPIDTTIQIEKIGSLEIGSLEIKYFPLQKELLTSLSLNPIPIETKIIELEKIIEIEKIDWTLLIGSTCGALLIGILFF